MKQGDIVVRKSYGKDIAFTIIEIKKNKEGTICLMNGLNLRITADAPIEDLEKVEGERLGISDVIFNKKVNNSIRNILRSRATNDYKIDNRSFKAFKSQAAEPNETMIFKRPGKVLHIDGDARYLEICLKVYKQLAIEASGEVISEAEQPSKVLDLVKQYKPDIVVVTGHDSIVKDVEDYMDINNYRNTKYFVETVSMLREYEPDYDTLVIFAGACQSCYEAILDAGANFTKVRLFGKDRKERSHFFLTCASSHTSLPIKFIVSS